MKYNFLSNSRISRDLRDQRSHIPVQGKPKNFPTYIHIGLSLQKEKDRNKERVRKEKHFPKYEILYTMLLYLLCVLFYWILPSLFVLRN